MGERFAFSIDPVDSRIADAPMPAMMLLPLVDHVMAHAPTECHAGSARVHATAKDGGIRLEIAGIGTALAAEVEGVSIAGVRGQLASLYARRAALEIERREAGDSVAILQIPHE